MPESACEPFTDGCSSATMSLSRQPGPPTRGSTSPRSRSTRSEMRADSFGPANEAGLSTPRSIADAPASSKRSSRHSPTRRCGSGIPLPPVRSARGHCSIGTGCCSQNGVRAPFRTARFLADLRVGPPNRAYRKLWEAFVVLGRFPERGDVAVDLGASPGGWSWLLAELGCRVVAVDKAPLDAAVADLGQVSSVRAAPSDCHPPTC